MGSEFKSLHRDPEEQAASSAFPDEPASPQRLPPQSRKLSPERRRALLFLNRLLNRFLRPCRFLASSISRPSQWRKSYSSFRLTPHLHIFLGIFVSLIITITTSTLAYRSSPAYLTTAPTLKLARLPAQNVSPYSLAKLSTSLADLHNEKHVEDALVRFFDIPPSLTRKIPLQQRYALLTKLQTSRNGRHPSPRRLFILHVVGSLPQTRLSAIATAITYATNTNRFLLILWDTARGGEPFGADPLVPLPSLDKHHIMLTYVNSLHLTPNLTNWSEFQINYYTKSGGGGYPLDSIAALATRHIFFRTGENIEGRYAAMSPGVMMLPTLFRPGPFLHRHWFDFIKDWTFPQMDPVEVADLLNRVYGVPFMFIEGMSDMSKRSLLRALDRSTSKRAFFIHAMYGLGNRLRALGSAMAVAQVTGRVLVLIWEPDVHLNCRFTDLFVNDIIVLDKFNMGWPPGDANTKDHAMRTVDFYNFMRFNGKHIHNPLTELVNPRSGRHVYVKSAYVVRSSFTPRIISTTSRYWKLMREQLVPKADIMYLVHDPSFVNIRGMVGVHIRSRTIENDIKGVSEEFYGNGSRTTDHWRRLTGLKTFEAKIMRLSLRYKFYVAADAREAITELERKFGSHRIFSLPRDEDCVTRDVECAKLALADILLLSKVPTLLGSHWSSFTEGAVRLSGRVKVLLAGVHFGRQK